LKAKLFSASLPSNTDVNRFGVSLDKARSPETLQALRYFKNPPVSEQPLDLPRRSPRVIERRQYSLIEIG
jgi:hypothetical protein